MSQTTIQPAPVKKVVTVNATAEKAFKVFTDGLDRWWPRSHHIGKPEMARAVLEPRAGGRWYEIGADGSECDWGEVLAWEPPLRLMLAWRITPGWQFDPNAYSEVEVVFTPLADGTTRVDFEHRKLEGLGGDVATMRASIDSPGGWGGILEGYKAAAEA